MGGSRMVVEVEHKPMRWYTETQLCTRELRGTNNVQLFVYVAFQAVGRAIGAYHTSVVVNGFEFFFDHKGLRKRRHEVIGSHHDLISATYLGGSARTGDDLCDALAPHFQPGSYDLILKNCNSFTDAAIHYLLGLRLCKECSVVERVLGQNLDTLENLTLRHYSRNPKAADFCLEDVIALWMSFEVCC